VAPPAISKAIVWCCLRFTCFKWGFARNARDSGAFYTTLSCIRLIGHSVYQERVVIEALAELFATSSSSSSNGQLQSNDSKRVVQWQVVRTVASYLWRCCSVSIPPQ
jgi:hypothetical protein